MLKAKPVQAHFVCGFAIGIVTALLDRLPDRFEVTIWNGKEASTFQIEASLEVNDESGLIWALELAVDLGSGSTQPYLLREGSIDLDQFQACVENTNDIRARRYYQLPEGAGAVVH